MDDQAGDDGRATPAGPSDNPSDGPDGDRAPERGGRRWRWRWLVGGALGVVALTAGAAWWGWYHWFPTWRPALDADERYGVDVSHHQGEVDWEQVAADDIDFAYIKATEGADWADPQFGANWDGASAADLDRGAYHFFTLCTPGAEQAENFLRVVPDDSDALPPVIDLELGGNCSDRPDQEWIDREVGIFLDEVEEATGQPVVLYVGHRFEGRYGVRDSLSRPVWHRRIFLGPDVDDWWIWQFHYRADVAGIDGGADLNVMRGAPPEGP